MLPAQSLQSYPILLRPYVLSMGFSMQEYWSWLLCLPLGVFPTQGSELASPVSPALQVDSLPTGPPGKPSVLIALCYSLHFILMLSLCYVSSILTFCGQGHMCISKEQNQLEIYKYSHVSMLYRKTKVAFFESCQFKTLSSQFLLVVFMSQKEASLPLLVPVKGNLFSLFSKNTLINCKDFMFSYTT